jgi:hypothetical protein
MKDGELKMMIDNDKNKTITFESGASLQIGYYKNDSDRVFKNGWYVSYAEDGYWANSVDCFGEDYESAKKEFDEMEKFEEGEWYVE